MTEYRTLQSPDYPDGIKVHRSLCSDCVGQGKVLFVSKRRGVVKEIDPCPRCGGTGKDPTYEPPEEGD